jgi:ABC-type uncharacterized transport system auxiliary subunit
MRRYSLIFPCITALLLFGCFGKTPDKRYYLIDYVPTPTRDKAGHALRPASLRIKEFNVAEAYNRPEIVYRKSAHEMQFYNYHRWAVKPEYMITDMVFKHLKTANLFKSISRTLGDSKPDYVLSGEVVAIEEYDNKEKWFAHLAINFYLEDTKAKRQIWQRTYDVRKVVAQHEPVFIIRELSYLLEHTMDKVVVELENLLPKYLPPKNEDDQVESPKKQSKSKPEEEPEPKDPSSEEAIEQPADSLKSEE